MKSMNRRQMIKRGLGTALVVGFPAIVPSSVFGNNAPSNRITIGVIGAGRRALKGNIPGVLKFDDVQIVAVCDVDSNRLTAGQASINDYYAKKTGAPYLGVNVYSDYHALLADSSIDAVLVSTPDHWHAMNAIHAVRAKKDVYLEKPATLTIAEGKALVDEVKKSGRIVQIGSQQRSWTQFRIAAQSVRNGRIGDLQRVEVGLPFYAAGGVATPMSVPSTLDYDRWLGSTPVEQYTVDRVHPQVGYSEPGWMHLRQFSMGTITGWGAHHIDTAHWAMNTDLTGPIEVSGEASYPKSGLWDVHGDFKTEALYANGVRMTVSGRFNNGIKFIGSKGWIFVCRGQDPSGNKIKEWEASNPAIMSSVILPTEIPLTKSNDHHRNWLDSIRSRKPPIAPVEIGHRSCSTCIVHDIAMVLKRKVQWDPVKEMFIDDAEANALLSRDMRAPYQI